MAAPQPRSARQWSVIRLLLRDHEANSFAIARELEVDPSDMQRTLTRMDRAGLIEREHRGAGQRATRTKPAARWRVVAEQEERLRAGAAALERADAERRVGADEREPARPRTPMEPREGRDQPATRSVAALGMLVERQALVVVKVTTPALPRLLTLLGTGEITIGTSWVARLEGDGHQFVFAFEPGSDPTAPDRVVARLAAGGFECSAVLVRHVAEPMAAAVAAREATGA